LQFEEINNRTTATPGTGLSRKLYAGETVSIRTFYTHKLLNKKACPKKNLPEFGTRRQIAVFFVYLIIKTVISH